MVVAVVDAAPFRALRYNPAVTGAARATSAPALDDLNRFDYARHRTASPYTVLELLSDHEVAASALARWRRTGVLELDDRPAFYAYEQRAPHPPHVQRGLLAAVRVERGDPAAILPHEDVDPSRVAARLERLLAVGIDIAPVFTLAADLPQLARGLLDDALTRPLVELTDEAGAVHRLAACAGAAEITALRGALAGVPVLIADGHHRYAAAVAASQLGAGERTLMLVVDAARSAPVILPVHRLLPALAPDWKDRLAPDFDLLPAPTDAASLAGALAAAPQGTVALRVPGAGFLLSPADLAGVRAALPPGRSPLWRTLDTALLDHAVLPRLGVGPREVRYRTDLDAVAEVERAGTALILVRPVPLPTVRALAAWGERLPGKTTSFRPKPRTGLVLRVRGGESNA